MVKKQQFLID